MLKMILTNCCGDILIATQVLNQLRELREDAGDRRRAAARQARFFCDAYGVTRNSCFEELVWVAD